MATNKIYPFATNSSANVLTDEELSERSQLQTGFAVKSKADSALIGKLMQNATASAYAIGEFTVKYSGSDVSGSDHLALATNFESALTEFVEQKAPSPDLSAYATKANPAFTGTATLNEKAIATTDQIPTDVLTKAEASSTYATASSVTQLSSTVANKADASALANYAQLNGAAFTGAVTVQMPNESNNPATKAYVDAAVSSVYKYKDQLLTMLHSQRQIK